MTHLNNSNDKLNSSLGLRVEFCNSLLGMILVEFSN